jgi:Spy/CpxP family protein refolding chaperone
VFSGEKRTHDKSKKKEQSKMISMKKTLIPIILILLLTPAGLVFSQGPPPSKDDRPGRGEEREKIRENIETLRVYKLLEVLNLTEEQSTQFLPALKEFQSAKKSFEDRRRNLLEELETTLNAGSNDKKLKDILAELEDNRNQFQAATDSYLDKAKSILTVEQQAQLYLFEDRFERRIRETIEQIRGGHSWGKDQKR